MKGAATKRVLVINAHPDGGKGHLCDALAGAYENGARTRGHDIRRVDLAALQIPFLTSKNEFEKGEIPEELGPSVADLLWADHIVFILPLWLGTMPALLKAWLEHAFRPDVAYQYLPNGRGTKSLLDGKTARVIVTMGMPAPIYRLWFLSHGLAGLRRNILNFAGIGPVRETFFGMVELVAPEVRRTWIEKVRDMGSKAV